jgi:hypothetical protein
MHKNERVSGKIFVQNFLKKCLTNFPACGIMEELARGEGSRASQYNTLLYFCQYFILKK